MSLALGASDQRRDASSRIAAISAVSVTACRGRVVGIAFTVTHSTTLGATLRCNTECGHSTGSGCDTQHPVERISARQHLGAGARRADEAILGVTAGAIIDRSTDQSDPQRAPPVDACDESAVIDEIAVINELLEMTGVVKGRPVKL